MKKVLIAMAAMFLLIVFPGAAFWSMLSRLIGGGVSETYLYPIYGGIVLLAGLVVGCAVVILDEIKSLREEIRRGRGGDAEGMMVSPAGEAQGFALDGRKRQASPAS